MSDDLLTGNKPRQGSSLLETNLLLANKLRTGDVVRVIEEYGYKTFLIVLGKEELGLKLFNITENTTNVVPLHTLDRLSNEGNLTIVDKAQLLNTLETNL